MATVANDNVCTASNASYVAGTAEGRWTIDQQESKQAIDLPDQYRIHVFVSTFVQEEQNLKLRYRSNMGIPTLPPFQLDQYRLLYLEETRSITCITVKADPAFQQNDALEGYLYHCWKGDSVQITDILLRIILHTEACLTSDEASPKQFVLHGRGYTLMVQQKPWHLPEKLTFRQERLHPPSAPLPANLNPATNESSDQEGDQGKTDPISNEVWMDEVATWLWKYEVTYAPEEICDV